MNPVLNGVPSKPDNRDYKFTALAKATQRSYDLREFVRKVNDQGTAGSCTGQAVDGAIEIFTEQRGAYEETSQQFLYDVVRDLEGVTGTEGAYSIRDVLEVGRRVGIPLETEWVDRQMHGYIKPPDYVFSSASTRKIMRYEAVDISKSMILGTNPQLGIDNIKAALAEGMPVIINFLVGRKFTTLSGPLGSQVYYGVDYPGSAQTGNDPVGSHGGLITTCDDDINSFFFKSSWGTGWGFGGYGRLPYACIRDFSEGFVLRGYKEMTNIDPLTEASRRRLVKMYVAVLARAPELSGFKYWLDVLQSGKDTLAGIAQGMMLDTESRARFKTNGEIVCDMIDTDALFANRVEVAAYCVLDLACDKLNVAKAALDIVTADSSSVPLAKFRIRQMITGGVL